MTMISCPECTTEVSDQAMTCKGCGIQLRKPTRTFFGKLIKFLFVAFNIIMVLMMWVMFDSAGEVMSQSGSEAEAAGAAVGGVLGSGLVLSLWVFGDIILGLFMILTKPK